MMENYVLFAKEFFLALFAQFKQNAISLNQMHCRVLKL